MAGNQINIYIRSQLKHKTLHCHSFTFGTPTNHTASETAFEFNTSVTAPVDGVGGIVVWQQLVDAGTNKNSGQLASSSVDFDIPDKSSVTLTARTLSGTGTISAAFRLREEW